MEDIHTIHPPIVVQLSNVSKKFSLRMDDSLKERVVTLGRRGRKHREDFIALENIDLEISAGTTIGLIGHNGSGKSTLLKTIGGIISPNSGTVRRRGRLAALLELGAGFHPDLTGRENVFLNASILGMSRQETLERLEDILDFASIGDFIDTQVKYYSSGMYVRLAFAVAVHTDPDILLVDEVLAVGDEAFQRKCLDKIRSFQAEGRTIILVTHSLGQVVELCDRVVLLNSGTIIFDGEPQRAVTEFRNVLESRRRIENPHALELESAIGRITKVEIVNNVNESEILAGSDVTIRVGLESLQGLDKWDCAIQIDSPNGGMVLGTSTKRAEITIPPLSQEINVEFHLPSLALSGGKFFVNVSLLDWDGRHLHDIPQAVALNISPANSSTVGLLFVEPAISISSERSSKN